ncbi:hypothetical protein NDU88_009432 [Pleurodeles waltl]|uniref:Uncharacterized protein n=1 Tax=Pleurodeles waltl TaxID=8319 RepID=A0AAV7PVY0_PLEWA|nr:hypothetical protein NDU88_009432 [Pleurodeles waltl]
MGRRPATNESSGGRSGNPTAAPSRSIAPKSSGRKRPDDHRHDADSTKKTTRGPLDAANKTEDHPRGPLYQSDATLRLEAAIQHKENNDGTAHRSDATLAPGTVRGDPPVSIPTGKSGSGSPQRPPYPLQPAADTSSHLCPWGGGQPGSRDARTRHWAPPAPREPGEVLTPPAQLQRRLKGHAAPPSRKEQHLTSSGQRRRKHAARPTTQSRKGKEHAAAGARRRTRLHKEPVADKGENSPYPGREEVKRGPACKPHTSARAGKALNLKQRHRPQKGQGNRGRDSTQAAHTLWGTGRKQPRSCTGHYEPTEINVGPARKARTLGTKPRSF